MFVSSLRAMRPVGLSIVGIMSVSSWSETFFNKDSKKIQSGIKMFWGALVCTAAVAWFVLISTSGVPEPGDGNTPPRVSVSSTWRPDGKLSSSFDPAFAEPRKSLLQTTFTSQGEQASGP
ncbi:hypothetical protein BaRGS_00016122 [Batillaria attramentaria]|uniref:Uncharacterized protein n=1 Tax=Batillaria attramentaria TaxID=370345 RepID=A0ABD0L027_9CAEN